jgi:hypothetical protein
LSAGAGGQNGLLETGEYYWLCNSNHAAGTVLLRLLLSSAAGAVEKPRKQQT